jgi:hypothetical protein
MQLYHNDIISDVDLFSTNSDGTKLQPLRTSEGKGKDINIGDELTPVIGSGP